MYYFIMYFYSGLDMFVWMLYMLVNFFLGLQVTIYVTMWCMMYVWMHDQDGKCTIDQVSHFNISYTHFHTRQTNKQTHRHFSELNSLSHKSISGNSSSFFFYLPNIQFLTINYDPHPLCSSALLVSVFAVYFLTLTLA